MTNGLNKCHRCESSLYQNRTAIALKSLFYVFDGLIILLRNKKLIKLSVIPLIITFILVIITYTGSIYLLVQGLETYLPSGETASYTINLSKYTLAFLGSAALLVISLFLFLPLASLVCIPFNDIVSIETEKFLLGNDLNNDNTNSLSEIKVGIKEVFKLLIFKLVAILICLPVFLIPVAGQPLFLFLLAMITAIDFLDIVMARKRYSLSEKLAFIKKNSFSFVMFSIPLVLLFWIPIVQILIIPCYVIGGTKFFIHSEKKS